jgi:hypothetical protein
MNDASIVVVGIPAKLLSAPSKNALYIHSEWAKENKMQKIGQKPSKHFAFGA